MHSIALLFILLISVWLSNAVPMKNKIPKLQEKTFDLNKTTNYVVYWGSTDGEGPLTDYCNDSTYDVIILAFAAALDENGVPQLYIDYCYDNCSILGAQVKECQNNGKIVMLSLGGAAGAYMLKSNDYAKLVANHLWKMFLNGTGEQRPLANGVVLDGIDFDIEAGTKESNPYWVTLINELRRLSAADPSKHYYMSGAPQCVLPDAWFGPGPQTAISEADLDFISIQFYNNYCGVQAFFRTHNSVSFFALESFLFLEPGNNFNFDQWSSAVQQANPKMKLLMGIPASPTSGQGYQPSDNIDKICASIKKYPNYAGVMMWDAGDAKHNNNFGQQIRNGCLSQ